MICEDKQCFKELYFSVNLKYSNVFLDCQQIGTSSPTHFIIYNVRKILYFELIRSYVCNICLQNDIHCRNQTNNYYLDKNIF